MARRRKEIGVRLKRGKYQVFARIDGVFRQVPGGLPLTSTPGERAEAREQLIEQWGGAPVESGTIAADVSTYLALPEIAAMDSIDEREAHLELWLAALGRDRRTTSVTRDDLEAVLQTWLKTLSPVTVYHRRTAFRSFFKRMYPGVTNPVDGTTRPDHYRPVDRSVPFATMCAIVDRMPAWRYLKKGIRRPALAKLRAAVILHTGIPPAELGKLHARDFDRQAAEVRMPWRNKGAGTPAHTRRLSAEGVAAFVALEAADGFGPFAEESVSRSFKRAARAVLGRATVVRLYDLRHSLGADTYRATRDLATVGRVLGHAAGSIVTARYAMGAHEDVDRAAVAAVATVRRNALKLPAKLPARRKQQKRGKLRRAS